MAIRFKRKFKPRTFRKRRFTRKRSVRRNNGIKYDGMIKAKFTISKEMKVDVGNLSGKGNFDVVWGSVVTAPASNKVTM